MVAPDHSLAVLFADVSGSTRLYETLGDTEAHRIVGRLLEQLAEAIAAEGGQVVKTIGDEVMARFPEARPAVAAACVMQERFARAVRSPDAPAGIRIGLHFGPVLEEEGDVFGDTVNVAARMADLAKAGQILTTGETIERLPDAMRRDTRHLDRARVHGKEEEIDVFEVVWARDNVTSFVEIPRLEDVEPRGSLRVRFEDRDLRVSRESPVLSIGRDADNDVVIPYGVVSRRHARIEWRRGRLLLVDESTNGTLVTPDRGAPTFVRRDQVFLEGSGAIAPGFEPDTHPELLVRYTLEQDDA